MTTRQHRSPRVGRPHDLRGQRLHTRRENTYYCNIHAVRFEPSLAPFPDIVALSRSSYSTFQRFQAWTRDTKASLTFWAVLEDVRIYSALWRWAQSAASESETCRSDSKSPLHPTTICSNATKVSKVLLSIAYVFRASTHQGGVFPILDVVNCFYLFLQRFKTWSIR
jgi:hypothetical protein